MKVIKEVKRRRSGWRRKWRLFRRRTGGRQRRIGEGVRMKIIEAAEFKKDLKKSDESPR